MPDVVYETPDGEDEMIMAVGNRWIPARIVTHLGTVWRYQGYA